MPDAPNTNVVGYPLFPVYTAKAGGFFFVVFGVTTLIAALVTINPIWAYGPYVPDQVTAGSQPDWYIGFLDGMLRAFPNWETVIWGHTISWNVFIPALVMPGVLTTLLLGYPFLEAWITGDKREHHLLDRPRNAATRTGIGVMAITFYGILVLNGANDIIAQATTIPFNYITWFTRIGVFVFPPLMFVATRRFCLGLQRRDRELLLHGRESGQILRLPHGEFIEIHTPISDAEKAVILSKVDMPVVEAPPATDENGIAHAGSAGQAPAGQVVGVLLRRQRRTADRGGDRGGRAPRTRGARPRGRGALRGRQGDPGPDLRLALPRTPTTAPQIHSGSRGRRSFARVTRRRIDPVGACARARSGRYGAHEEAVEVGNRERRLPLVPAQELNLIEQQHGAAAVLVGGFAHRKKDVRQVEAQVGMVGESVRRSDLKGRSPRTRAGRR